MLLENLFFLLNQNNSLQHQNSKIILIKLINNKSQSESNLQNFNNNLQKSTEKNPLVK